MSFKRLFTYAGRILVGLLIVVLLGAAAVYAISQHRLHRTHRFTVQPVAVPSGAAAVARGRHIAATHGCADCHDVNFAGHAVVDNGLIGHLYGPNITKGRGGLPANFSDMDYVRAIRHGVDVNGRALVLMPSLEYSHLSDQDLGALIAYLKSLPPVDRERGPVTLGPLGRVLLTLGKFKLAADEIDHSAAPPVSVAAAVTPAYGRYLAASCVGCHGKNLAGGKIAAGPPDWPPAANLTPDASSRLSTWSDQDFINTIRTHRRPDGSTVSPVMPSSFGQMTDDELKAIWLYLRTVPPVASAAKAM